MIDNNDFGYQEELPPILSEEETENYFKLYKNGDKEARRVLIMRNLRLVVKVIENNFNNIPTAYLSDFMSEGTIGLIEALESYNIESETKFSNYASSHIKYVLKKLKRTLKRRFYLKEISFEEELINDETFDYPDYEEDVMENYLQTESDMIVRDSLKILNDFERDVIRLYYGFNGEGLSLKQIANIYDYSIGHIKAVILQAKRKLRIPLAEQGLGLKLTKND